MWDRMFWRKFIYLQLMCEMIINTVVKIVALCSFKIVRLLLWRASCGCQKWIFTMKICLCRILGLSNFFIRRSAEAWTSNSKNFNWSVPSTFQRDQNCRGFASSVFRMITSFFEMSMHWFFSAYQRLTTDNLFANSVTERTVPVTACHW